MFKVNETSKYRREKSEVLSDKKLKEVAEAELAKAEKDIENQWKKINKNGDDKENEAQRGNYCVKCGKRLENKNKRSQKKEEKNSEEIRIELK